MTKPKLNVKDIVKAMKDASKPLSHTKPTTNFNPVIKPGHKIRDMRQEAMDMGSHQAKEMFGEGQQ